MSTRLRDSYDDDVDYFLSRPAEIRSAWCSPPSHKHGRLFAFIQRDPSGKIEDGCGCPSMIKNDKCATGPNAEKLTAAIRALPLPSSDEMYNVIGITRDRLEAFATSQRLANEMIPGRMLLLI